MLKTSRKNSASLLLVIMAFGVVLPRASQAQVRPIYDRGATGLGQALKRLQTTASVMHSGAHPDDEDSGLLAYLARHDQARTAYLSLTRGDGGQNVIGDELFESLGVIRTEELLQARRLDGASQFFTRAMDYGFSKKLDEAKRMWNERDILGDMVRAIRLFRPLAVISRFSGTPADGHGHHQFAGYLTPIAVKAAADPSQFPEQIAEGLKPWKVLKFYRGQGFSQNQPPAAVTLNTGEYDPLLGRSYFEIAMEGRSQHKTQEQGLIELRGPQFSGENLIETSVPKVDKETSVFDGIDTSIKGIAALTNNTEEPFAQKLKAIQETAELALRSYNTYAPEKLVPIVAKGYKQAQDAELSTRNPDSKALLQEKQKEFTDALLLASGTVVDSLADSETIVAGDSTNVSVKVFAPNSVDVKLTKVELKAPANWKTESVPQPEAPPTQQGFRRREDARFSSLFKVTSAPDARLTEPYWLQKPRNGAEFDWSDIGSAATFPFQHPHVSAEVTLNFVGQEVTVSREVQYRYADLSRGELRRELNVVPAVSVGLDSDLLIAPVSNASQKYRLVMTVTNNKNGPAKGTAKFEVPNGWTLTPAVSDFDLKQKGDKTALNFELTIPANGKTDSYKLHATASLDGKTFDKEEHVIAYPHIQTHRIYTTANVTTQVLDLKVAPVRVGYIMGSGDRVPQAIKRLGLNVTMLDGNYLATGDLAQFDTIVVGIRASQTRPDYVANNGRLLEFVKNGGTMIVQYQQPDFNRLNLAPFPARIDGNIRVVDENAAVKILAPDNPVFNFPNKIGDTDWLNWVQERDLYCMADLDSKYTPLLESHDEGESPNNGGMVYAEIGKGKYIYTAYSWFRQLPAGNPGAYRSFANMLSLPKAGK
jgi:LmbE family N-acetylglucosaminyl deacetylase